MPGGDRRIRPRRRGRIRNRVRAPERACRWELAAGTPWRESPSGGGAAQPVTLLLDQCSGRTWMLVLHGPSFEWRPVRREPEFGFVLERP